MREHIRFLYLAASSAALTIAVVVGVNTVVDPFKMTRLIEHQDLNVKRPAIENRLRMIKTFDVRHLAPDVLVLGTSRSLTALRMTHPGWMEGTRYNASFDGARAKELFMMLQHAHTIRPTRQVVLALDNWLLLEWSSELRPDVDADLLRRERGVGGRLRLLGADARIIANLDTLRASVDTVSKQGAFGLNWLLPDGQRDGDRFYPFLDARGGLRASYLAHEREEVEYKKVLGPFADVGDAPVEPPARLTADEAGPSTMWLTRIVDFSRAHDIDLHIYLSPHHAVLSELDVLTGKAARLESLKRYLVEVLHEEGLRHPERGPFPLWDFSLYSSVTTEELPAGDTKAGPRFYWDPSHAKELVGDWMLDRVFGTSAAELPVPADFGVRLTLDNVDEVLARDRLAGKAYRNRGSADVLRIRLVAAEILKIPSPLRTLAGDLLVGYESTSDLETAPDARRAREIAARELNLMTPADALDWKVVHPDRGRYDFMAADEDVAFARDHGMVVHGPALVRFAELPAWLREGAWTAETLGAVLDEHVDRVVGHYRGRVAIWDVVHEAFEDSGPGPRVSPWRDVLGPGFIERAFRRAHQADPAAILLYTDSGIAERNAKSDAVYALMKELLARGVPVGGIGFQTQLSDEGIDTASVARNLRRFGELGLRIYITGLEVRLTTPATPEALERQAEVYGAIADVCLAEPACKALQLRGLSESHSWARTFQAEFDAPLLYDASHERTPAYDAINERLAARRRPELRM